MFITSILFAGEIIGQTYALVLAATIVTIGFVPFKEFIEKITNKLFYNDAKFVSLFYCLLYLRIFLGNRIIHGGLSFN